MRSIFVICIFVFAFIACRKKEVDTPEETTNKTSAPSYTIKDYIPLKYGNYWVYEWTITDTNNVIISSMIDSCYVQDSSFIRGHMFYHISGGNPNTFFYADSANYMIYTDGTRALSLYNNDTLRKTSQSYPSGDWYKMYDVMKTTPTTFVYNSNTFSNCINRYSFFYSNMNANCPDWILNNTFCPGVGLVYCSYGYINSCNVWEQKLLRYKIN